MTNHEIDPAEYECAHVTCADAIDIITAREVPLGGLRAMTVRRTLPQRKRSLIGPWCFVDHFGPDDVAATGGMQVARHPHTGLATVTLLFHGEIEHIDSTGFSNIVRPGEVNLMIAGSGISHSEFSSDATEQLHGVQLWYALPDALRNGMPESQHFVPTWAEVPGGRVLTYLGSFAGQSSPVDTRVPAHAAEILVDAGQTVEVDLDASCEHGVLLDSGALTLGVRDHEQTVAPDELAYLPSGPDALRLTAGPEAPARVIVVGGRPFGESIVMWWNFVGRSHDEIVAYRRAWQTEIGRAEDDGADGAGAAEPLGDGEGGDTTAEPVGDGVEGPRFGTFPPDQPEPIPAPPLPRVRIKPRRQS
ncbi:pirin family protein [Brevibacterium sp. NPDC049920]|uniref:Pirin family protein n=1 Tax=Brevibacterium pityocampae TaxID=506594 RepID=A0ABP8JG85_9MICO|nr:pirin family protein [uncultured Brevibacterium sp.]